MFQPLLDLYRLFHIAFHVRWKSNLYFRSQQLTDLDLDVSLMLRMITVLWAEYCDVKLKEVRREQSFEVHRMFLEYVRRVDHAIDTPEGSKHFIQNPKNYLKSRPEVQIIVSAIAKWVRVCKAPRNDKIALVNAIQHFRRVAIFSASRTGIELQIYDKITLSYLVPIIENTSGLWGITCVKILNILHHIPDETAERVESMFCHWMVAMQVVDDVFDYPDDRQNNSLNLVAAALKEYPEELNYLQAPIVNSKRVWGWFPKAAPLTYIQLEKMFIDHISMLKEIDPSKKASLLMRQSAIAAFRWGIIYELPPHIGQKKIPMSKPQILNIS